MFCRTVQGLRVRLLPQLGGGAAGAARAGGQGGAGSHRRLRLAQGGDTQSGGPPQQGELLRTGLVKLQQSVEYT